ncbi:tetratricopeptide repeat protein [Phenylobacterium sp.]|uniref:tetratricopeptide repeat protein n=1 Tax=Phenylobacterium sp. TaxID=1871053 RepID=UPI002CBBD4D8|nr:tetratricopeptide repeat protein [Phenylobacterium sp.]HVI30645.1 tetratricopeptide repeat protein [Phenylobacterium sp.]
MDVDEALRLAVERHRAGDLAAAEAGYRAVLAAGEPPGALRNLAVLLEATERTDEARSLYGRWAARVPESAAVCQTLGNFHRFTGELEAAERAYRRALELDPGLRQVQADLGLVLLAQGRYAEGWPLYEQRPRRLRTAARRLSFPEWMGEPLAGKRLFVWSEQGYGDQIMMARFVRQLGAAHVTLTCAPGLARLFAQLPAEIVPLADEVQASAHDYWVLPMSIPAKLELQAATIPGAPYLAARPRTGGGIGVMARGNPTYAWDRSRSPPPAIQAELLALPGAISLEPADTGAADFQDTAELVAGLDLVITSDTSVAHLAGALGRPTWLLLSDHGLDWRWMRDRTDTPWYPSLRLYRQPRAGDWAAVVAAVRSDLAQFTNGVPQD